MGEDERFRRSKIVGTVGPASKDPDTIAAMAEAGMDVARINTSHTTPETLPDYVERIEAARQMVDRPIGIMVDIQGPEVRTGPVDGPVTFTEGDEIVYVAEETVSADRIGLTVDVFVLSEGDRVLLDDGLIETRVVETGETVRGVVETGGTIDHRVGVNLPGVDVGIEVPTEKDMDDIAVAAEHDVAFVAVSFVRDAEDIYRVVEALEDRGVSPFVIAKIERAAAIERLDEIIAVADGIMVARGDLGAECPLEEVPTIQKRIIRQCRTAGVPVITATEMLESMIERRRPTRAEASDVANAVLDGTDAVMLSGETAVGDHPVHVTRMMDSLVAAVEESDEYADMLERTVPEPSGETAESLARSARDLAHDVGASAIVVESESGYTARKASKFRPQTPIIATTPDESVSRTLALSWGVHPRHVDLTGESTDDIITSAVDAAIAAGPVDQGDTVVVLSGMMRQLEQVRTTDLLKIHVVAERLAAGTGVVPGRGHGAVVSVDDVGAGSVVLVPAGFEGNLPDLSGAAAVVYGGTGRMSSVAVAAREAGVPMICGVDADAVPIGETVTVDAVRGVVYEGVVSRRGGEEKD